MSGNIFFSSDLHINHNKEFIYEIRGFDSVEEMNEAIIERFNAIVTPNDTLYLLGDSCMGPVEAAAPILKRLHGNIIYSIGNHDTNKRLIEYKHLGWKCIGYADMLVYKKYSFLLSHWPTLVANQLDKPIWNLSGHTHSKNIFNYLNVYNVAVDAHDCFPISLDEILDDIKEFKNGPTILESYE